MNLRKDHFNNNQNTQLFLHRVLLFLLALSWVGEVAWNFPAASLFFFSFYTNSSDLDTNVTSANASNNIHLSTMDLLVLATMKNAAKCENVVWIAEFNESSTLWTHIAPKGPRSFGMLGWVSVIYHNTHREVSGKWALLSIAWRIKNLALRWSELNSGSNVVSKG